MESIDELKRINNLLKNEYNQWSDYDLFKLAIQIKRNEILSEILQELKIKPITMNDAVNDLTLGKDFDFETENNN